MKRMYFWLVLALSLQFCNSQSTPAKMNTEDNKKTNPVYSNNDTQ